MISTVPSAKPQRFFTTLFTSLLLALACSKSEDAPSGADNPSANYGEERIGYKQQRSNDVNGVDITDAQGAAVLPVGNAAPGTPVVAINPSPGALPIAPPADAAELTEPESLPAEPSLPAGAAGAAAVTPAPVSEPTQAPQPVLPLPPDAGTAPDAGGLPLSSADAGSRRDAGSTGVDAGAASPFLALAQELPVPQPGPASGAALQPENPYRSTEEMAASTFSIDVDTGAYTLARAALNQGVLPNPSVVRIEEFINYFHLHYAQPQGDAPFSVYSELGNCPWNPEHQLMMIGIQGQEVPLVDQPPANLVFLLDVSGSMNEPNKLPLLKKGFRMLIRQLRAVDRVSIVTYAGSERVVLEGVAGDQKSILLTALDQLEAAGSTNGEGGIQRAYALAQQHFITGGNNRVLLATDGDFNVGLSQTAELAQFIATKRETGVFLSVYGFGSPTGNFQDPTAEQLADNGNGVYFFIDGVEEARRAFIHTVTGSLLTVAKDVKLQVEFNPDQVNAYRLIGYENRVLNNADFSNDAVDAGELGAGLSVTAFFELIPAGSSATVPSAAPGTDPLLQLEPTTQTPSTTEQEFEPVRGSDLAEVRIRYKGRDASVSELIAQRYSAADIQRAQASLKFSFASAVAELAMQLRGSQYLPARRTGALRQQIQRALPAQIDGAVQEFLDLTTAAHRL